ncbi:hypothetical protein BDA99DRAFT_526042, partial [Phascolomyces articulosus]
MCRIYIFILLLVYINILLNTFFLKTRGVDMHQAQSFSNMEINKMHSPCILHLLLASLPPALSIHSSCHVGYVFVYYVTFY